LATLQYGTAGVTDQQMFAARVAPRVIA